VADVERRLGPLEGVRIHGLYGSETGLREGLHPEAAAAGSRAVEEVLPRVLELAGEVPGTLVEPKGSNLAVHYRLSPEPEAARTRLLRALEPLARDRGLKLIEGKKVLELAPSGALSKGDLVAREARGLEAVLYAGDDAADMEAFAALDALAAAGAHTVKVAVRSGETPQELLEAADLTVEGPAGLLRMLEGLLL
jgi:trehalose 6-phosphate phosphatase